MKSRVIWNIGPMLTHAHTLQETNKRWRQFASYHNINVSQETALLPVFPLGQANGINKQTKKTPKQLKKNAACLPWKTWRSLHSWVIVLRAHSFISGRRRAPLASPAFAAPCLGGDGADTADILQRKRPEGSQLSSAQPSASAVPGAQKRAVASGGRWMALPSAPLGARRCPRKQLARQLGSSLSQSLRQLSWFLPTN